MNENIDNSKSKKIFNLKILSFAFVILVIIVGIIVISLWGCPKYEVYCHTQDGLAKLAEAESSRRIAVLEAEAKKDSAVRLAEAEVLRAQGVAKANQIIGESLKDNEAYLRYLWIQNLVDGKNEVIYVPTEANLPILEAGRNFNRHSQGQSK